jgi:hypothetical protein
MTNEEYLTLIKRNVLLSVCKEHLEYAEQKLVGIYRAAQSPEDITDEQSDLYHREFRDVIFRLRSLVAEINSSFKE